LKGEDEMKRECKKKCLNRTLVIVGGIILLYLVGLNLRADVFAEEQTQQEESGIFNLGEVVVSAEREEKEGPTTISEVTAEDIKRQNATNVGEAMKLLPGVHFRQGRQTDEYYVTVRGFDQDKVLILLDGVPLYVPYEGLLNLSDIPVQNIAKIKVIKGNASTLYGPNSMGGVINIITKKGGEKPTFSFDSKMTDNDTQHLTFTHGWKWKNVSYFLGVSHRESNGFNLADTFRLPQSVNDSITNPKPHTNPSVPGFSAIPPDKGRRENTDYDRNAVTLSSTLDLTPNHQLGVSFEYYDNSYGISPSPRYREHKNGFFYFPRYYRFTDWERYVVNVVDELKIGDTWRFKIRGFYDYYMNALNSYDDATYSTMERIGPPSGRSIYQDYNAGFSFNTFWTGIRNNELRSGISFKRDTHKDRFLGDTTKLASDTFSYALEDEAKLLENLTMTLGVSYDIFAKVRRNQTGIEDPPVGNDDYIVNPMIGFSYDLTPSLNLTASAGRKVRFPTMRNLYNSGVLGPQGDPNLKPQKSVNYDVGGNLIFNPKLWVDGALFYNDIDNYINFDNQLGRFEQYRKVGIYGVEMNVSVQPTDHFTGRIGYTYLHARNYSNVTIENSIYSDLTYKPDEIPYRPAHKVDLDLSQKFDFGTEIDFNGSFLSSQIFYDHADRSNNKILVANKERLKSCFLLNAKVSQKLFKYTTAYIAVENFLNEEYQDLYLLPGRGLTGWAGLKFDL